MFRSLLAFSLLALAPLAPAANPFVGRWALTIPNGHAGWLGVEEKGGALSGSLLWGGGSVLPLKSVAVEGDTLTVLRATSNKDGSEAITTITAKISGDALELTTANKKPDGTMTAAAKFTGTRIAPLPPAPDLTKVKYGAPVSLSNGKDLTGWRIVEPNAFSGWSVVEGVLQNRLTPGKSHGNLRTEREFEDFNLTLECRTQKDSNSGIYLRGIYEIQVAETYGKPLDPHNMGALYSRITPGMAAEKPIDEWQTFDITLVDRHVTVILNGQKIIDNQPVLGCTGGALTSDETKPGPLMLQGDHSSIDYRKIVLRPVEK